MAPDHPIEPTDAKVIVALGRYLDATGTSQNKFAERAEVSQTTLSRLLAGKQQDLRTRTRDRILRNLPARYLVPVRPTRRPESGPRDTYRVFVSSTYLDNAERRKLVLDAIDRASMSAISMERWTADERTADDVSLQRIEEADLYLGIVAWRYGWIPKGETKSITELEYEAAEGTDRLLFVIDEHEARINPAVDYDSGEDRWHKQELLEAFKRRIAAEQMATPFTDENLAVKVHQALTDWRGRQRNPIVAPKRTRSQPAPRSAPELILPDYLELLRTEHESIRLAGFDRRLRVSLRLSDLYVPLRAIVDRRATDSLKLESAEQAAEQLHHGEEDEISLIHAFEQLDRKPARRGFVILGDPGSGKTTHLRRVVLGCATEGPEKLGLPAGMVPVLLPLRRLKQEDRTLDGFARRLLADPLEGMDDEEFAAWLWKRGRLLLLLDGLDEVPEGRRGEVREWIEKEARRKKRENVLVVTCRYAGYRDDAKLGPDFLEMHLMPFSNEQAEQFIRSWFHIVETTVGGSRNAETRAEERAGELIERLRRPDFRASRIYSMTHNPLLLTAICLIQYDRGRLPHASQDLYDECIKVLLQKWREAKGLSTSLDPAKARKALQKVAYDLHEREVTRASTDSLAKSLEPAMLAARWNDITPERFLATIRDESGLLTGWSGESFGFMHLGFQEYLAAHEVRSRIFACASDNDKFRAELARIAKRFGSSWWSEVIVLMLAVDEPSLFAPFFREVVQLPAFAENDELLDMCMEEALHFDPAPFVELLQEEDAPARKDLVARKHVALRVLSSAAPEAIDEETRKSLDALIGEYASTIAPRRDELVSREGGVRLVRIPGGTFRMGSSSSGLLPECPVHNVTVPAFELAVHPVTNEQYGRFLGANPGAEEPRYWGDRKHNRPTQPVVGVSWNEAQAFCAWAGLVLPTEAQWEYACRAGSKTRYSSGDNESDLDREGWYGEKSNGSLHSVGEKDANPFGLFDMHGNVWEWCQDSWSEDYSKSSQAHPDAFEDAGDPRRVYRGGSFLYSADGARSACRSGVEPSGRYRSLGFRPARVISG